MRFIRFIAIPGLALACGATLPAVAEGGPSSYYLEPWGVVYRNTLGGPSAALRLGPWGRSPASANAATVSPPYGIGSLGIIVGGGTEQIEFGDETTYAGMPLTGVTTLKYWLFDGQDAPPVNVPPHIKLEVDPNLTPAVNYTSLNYLPLSSTSPSAPPAREVNNWQQYEPSAAGSAWYASNGATATATGCSLTTPCTFSTLKSRLPDAVITLSVGVAKGRDNAFAGAVDGVQINDRLYDFEPNGVRRFQL
jgi:hypothetical protein